MRIRLHLEAKYDRRHNIEGTIPPQVVVVKRCVLEADVAVPLVDVLEVAGSEIFDGYHLPVDGCNPRIEITALQVDGIWFKSQHMVALDLKAKQPV